jgi:hypothetical protein
VCVCVPIPNEVCMDKGIYTNEPKYAKTFKPATSSYYIA